MINNRQPFKKKNAYFKYFILKARHSRFHNRIGSDCAQQMARHDNISPFPLFICFNQLAVQPLHSSDASPNAESICQLGS